MSEIKRRVCRSAWTWLCLCGICGMGLPLPTASASGPLFPLAQAVPAPAPTPANVQKVGRMYVVESVVILVLFGGALYAVCRTSRRT